MDKQMIEELEKDIAVRMAMAKGVAGSMNNGVEGWLGEYLIEKGWTQIPENAVVLTNEEYDKLKSLAKGHCEYCYLMDLPDFESERMVRDTTRKETAEKYHEAIQRIIKESIKNQYISIARGGVLLDGNDEILKKITEGKDGK